MFLEGELAKIDNNSKKTAAGKKMARTILMKRYLNLDTGYRSVKKDA